MNFKVDDAGTAIESVLSAYGIIGLSIDQTDGVGLAFGDLRFNLRHSNTKPLAPLNIEGKGQADTLAAHVSAISDLLGGLRG